MRYFEVTLVEEDEPKTIRLYEANTKLEAAELAELDNPGKAIVEITEAIMD